MYGYGMGKLKIYVSVNDKEKRLLNISGNKENRWLQAFIDISQSTPYNIIFEGTRELYVWSDIAIDIYTDFFFVTILIINKINKVQWVDFKLENVLVSLHSLKTIRSTL
jgi:hypothetical protein